MTDSDEWSDYDDDCEDYLSAPPELTKGISYEVLEERDIKSRQSQAIQKLSEEFDLEYSQAAVLLIQNNWNPSEVIEKLLNSELELPGLIRQISKTLSSNESTICPSCYLQHPGYQMIGMDCGHYLCKACYKNYLTESINQGIESIFTKCPMPDCQILVPQSHFETLVKGPVFEKYKRFIFNSFVDSQKDVKWCPASGCTNAAIYPKRKAREIICKCGYSWCFGCGNETHRPLTCELLTRWNNKLKSDDSQLWLLANTKTCPKCKNPIEKNLGCMHMTCKCKYEFCWLCLGDWKLHCEGSVYECNKFKDQRQKGVFSDKEKAQQKASFEIRRFKHYYDRYLNHKSSLKLAQAAVEFSRNEFEAIQRIICESTSLDFRVEAHELVYRSKLALTYTYAFGYFLESSSKLEFFEFIQGELENNVLKLEGLLENKLERYLNDSSGRLEMGQEFWDYRIKVLSLVSIVKNYFDECLTQIETGFPDVQDKGKIGSETYGVNNLDFTGVWICAACTLANALNLENCIACGSRRLNISSLAK